MGLVKSDDRLWKSARLTMKGAYSSTEWVPPTGDPKEILDFLHFHISPTQRETTGGEPIYHAFRSIAIGTSAGTRCDLSAYNFGGPFFIDAMVQFLSNKLDHIRLQRMSLLILPELDNLVFTSEAAFGDPESASKFVNAWSTAVDEFLRGETDPLIEAAAVETLLSIANLPCLRVHLRPEHWDLAYKFTIILYSDSPSMKRCIQNPDILPFIKESAGNNGALGWLGMLWMKYPSLPNEVLEQLEAETREIGSGLRYFDLDSYVSMFDSELKRLQTIIEGLEPMDRTVSGLRSDLDTMTRTRDRLVDLQKEGQRSSQPKERQDSPPSPGWFNY